MVASVWLFALLVLVKSTFATACLPDAVVPPATDSVVVAGLAADTPVMSATIVQDAAEADCPDSAAADGHCACAHASPMSPMHAGWSLEGATMRHDEQLAARHPAARPRTTLRPPIRC
jgi:hypothetical protein